MQADITTIEYALFKKLGKAERSDDDQFETEPVNWLEDSSTRFMLSVRLRVWRHEQRYAVYGPVIVNADGSVIWQ